MKDKQSYLKMLRARQSLGPRDFPALDAMLNLLAVDLDPNLQRHWWSIYQHEKLKQELTQDSFSKICPEASDYLV